MKRMYCVIVEVGGNAGEESDELLSEAVRQEFPDSVIIHTYEQGWRMRQNKRDPEWDPWGGLS